VTESRAFVRRGKVSALAARNAKTFCTKINALCSRRKIA
jgi:hypothetical protein